MNFWKYQANGNDFVIFDDRRGSLVKRESAFFNRICDRKIGVGADGILFLKESLTADYKMVYLNADGNEVSMCGNGARALTHFVHNIAKLGASSEYTFETQNGVYNSRVSDNGRVYLTMTELYDEGAIEISDLIRDAEYSYYLNTGVPHCVFKMAGIDEFPLEKKGSEIRFDQRFEAGVNVNIFEVIKVGENHSELKMRTFERGVEAETLACGTGAMAVALTYLKSEKKVDEVKIQTPGGTLVISIQGSKREFSGDVRLVFEGHFLE